MLKSDIQKIRIDIRSDDQSALSLMLCRDGTVGRQGDGSLPPHKTSVLGVTDGTAFRQVMELLDETIFARQGVYDLPDKQGLPINYSIAFLGEKPNVAVFEFRLGLENGNVGDLLPYFDGLIKKAIASTEAWYANALTEQQAKQKVVEKPKKHAWWPF